MKKELTLENLEQEIQKLKQRNKKVEADKAWETSFERKVLVVVLTYVLISIVMYFLEIDKPLVNAIIPTCWYLLSTVSIWLLKNIYIEKYTKKRGW